VTFELYACTATASSRPASLLERISYHAHGVLCVQADGLSTMQLLTVCSHVGVCLLPLLCQVEGRSPSFSVPLDPAHAAKVRAANEIVRNSWQYKVGDGAAVADRSAAAGAKRCGRAAAAAAAVAGGLEQMQRELGGQQLLCCGCCAPSRACR
jgi:hypothetical protein